MGEDQLVLLDTEVLPFFFLFYFSHHSLSCFWSFCRVLLFIHSSLIPLLFQALRKICLANHICSIAELLPSDVMQQMEVVLLGLPAAKLLDILSMSMQSKPSTQHQAAPPNLRQYLSIHWPLPRCLLHPHHSYCRCYGYKGAN